MTKEPAISVGQANDLVLEHQGWAESIARSVARSWNLDWQLDGLDGAAFEALIFCSRRFQPDRGVPFRGYARRRIHEASTEAARKSKSWQRGIGTKSKQEQQIREVSAELFTIFPELHRGRLPTSDDAGTDEQLTRAAIQQLLMGASIVAARQNLATGPDDLVEYKRLVGALAELEPVHQSIMWQVYWEGLSLRGVAEQWNIDELNVIREHKVILLYLQRNFSRSADIKLPKVRPGLRDTALQLKHEDTEGIFEKLLKGELPHDEESQRPEG